jgi:hypothetical protein
VVFRLHLRPLNAECEGSWKYQRLLTITARKRMEIRLAAGEIYGQIERRMLRKDSFDGNRLRVKFQPASPLA